MSTSTAEAMDIEEGAVLNMVRFPVRGVPRQWVGFRSPAVSTAAKHGR